MASPEGAHATPPRAHWWHYPRRRKKVLLWAHLGATGSAGNAETPLLLRDQLQITDKTSVPFAWLTADLGLEAAKLPTNQRAPKKARKKPVLVLKAESRPF